MSKLLKYKPTFDKEELHSLEKAFKLFADRNGYMNLNNMAIAMKELKFDESESVIYDLIIELESENKSSITYDDFIDKLTAKLQDRESQRSTERVYELFVEDPDNKIQSIVSIANIKSITLPEAQYSTINQRYLLSEKNKSHDIQQYN